jgi:uncharacterized protein (DUF1501 family)
MPTTFTRRNFIKMSAALPTVAAWPHWWPRLAFAPPQTAPRGDVLICIFLRGAADGLNMIVPHGEDIYYQERPTLAIPRPDDRRREQRLRTVDLDGFFGLHPALIPLLPLWQAGHLAAIQAVGSPDETRSHFEAMELMERGIEQKSGPPSGWLGRHLATLDTSSHSPWRGVTIGEMVARSLYGPIPTSALRSIADFHLGGDTQALAAMQTALARLYNLGDPLDLLAAEAIEMLAAVNALDPFNYQPAHAAIYPEDEFGLGLKQVAMLIKAEAGLEVACLDVGGWDTHFAQGSSEGLMANLLTSLAGGLTAFYQDLSEKTDRLLVVVMSEFGRRLRENGSLGTDHGHGSVMLLLGGHVAGQKVHGLWPGLAPEQLAGPGDLAITTDYRDILGEIILRRLNNPHLAEIFPAYTPVFKKVIRE